MCVCGFCSQTGVQLLAKTCVQLGCGILLGGFNISATVQHLGLNLFLICKVCNVYDFLVGCCEGERCCGLNTQGIVGVQ